MTEQVRRQHPRWITWWLRQEQRRYARQARKGLIDMSKPAYHCGADDCCGGEQYPECQLIETSDGRNYTIQATEAFRYDPDQDYTAHHFTD